MSAIQARLRVKLNHSTPPSEQMLAWIDYRQEMHIEPGLEGLTGPAATYHLITDVPRLMRQAAQILACKGKSPIMIPLKERPRAALGELNKAFGARYVRGIEGIKDALEDAGASPERIARFNAERTSFTAKYEPLVDAAWVVNERGENPNAVHAALELFVDEVERLCYWLTVAGQSSHAELMRDNLGRVLSAPPNANVE